MSDEKPLVHFGDGLGLTLCGVETHDRRGRRRTHLQKRLAEVTYGPKNVTCGVCALALAVPEPQRVVKWWSTTDDLEQLYYSDIEEAVDVFADDHFPDVLPETVTAFGWAQVPLPSARRIGECAIEHVLEYLDEEHGDPNESTELTDEMRAAAVLFGETIRKLYPTWSCEVVTQREVRIADHVDVEEYERNAATERAKAVGA